MAVWVRFGFQLDSLEKSDLVNVENFVGVLTISFVYVDSEQPLTSTKPLPYSDAVQQNAVLCTLCG